MPASAALQEVRRGPQQTAERGGYRRLVGSHPGWVVVPVTAPALCSHSARVRLLRHTASACPTGPVTAADKAVGTGLRPNVSWDGAGLSKSWEPSRLGHCLNRAKSKGQRLGDGDSHGRASFGIIWSPVWGNPHLQSVETITGCVPASGWCAAVGNWYLLPARRLASDTCPARPQGRMGLAWQHVDLETLLVPGGLCSS